MIDIYAPMELDDGRVATLADDEDYDEGELEDAIPVIITGPWQRGVPMHDDSDVYWYSRETGVWEGSTAENAYVLRNVVEDPVEPEDWS